jgi:aldehyde:ferredoxin oxidoreductase
MGSYRGYTGKVLRVDLSTQNIQEQILPDEMVAQYLCGTGLGVRLLHDWIPAGADPLGPANVLGFVSGLLTATGSLFTGRWMVVAKSPLTGGWGDANCGGTFSPAIKRCGYDGIFFTGQADRPVYLYVDSGRAELRDASGLWGKDALETEEILIRETGGQARVACIGPAGEKLSLISGICNDQGRLAARAGLGAVMGSKQLKAVVLNGKRRITAHNRNEINRLSQRCNRWVQFQPPFVSGRLAVYLGALIRILPVQFAQDGLLYKIMLRKWGTSSMNQVSVEMGDAPVKNWLGSNLDFDPKRSKTTNPDEIIAREKVKYHCYSCPLGCGGICAMTDRGTETHKPEYETVLALGGLCMNEDLDSIFDLNDVLNRAGMDSISAGATAAFAVECFEQGILTREDTDGLELRWGNTQAIVDLVKKMIAREGIGDILADGSALAAERIGRGAAGHTVLAGRQELAMHDGRNDPGFALHYFVEPTAARHTIGSQLYYEMFRLWKRVKDVPKARLVYHKNCKYESADDKARAAAACSKFMNVVNGAGACMFACFLGVDRFPIFEWLNAATGWHRSAEAYLEVGARIQTLKQAFNIKHGLEPNQVEISDRATGRVPLQHGANRGRTVDLEHLAQSYWRQFGWDARTGKPTEEIMRRLGENDWL